MTTLEALARALAQQPDNALVLHAFVDLLKESEPAAAMETVQTMLTARGDHVTAELQETLQVREGQIEGLRGALNHWMAEARMANRPSPFTSNPMAGRR